MSSRFSLILMIAGCNVYALPHAPTPAEAARGGGPRPLLSRIEVAPTTAEDGIAVYTYAVAPNASALTVDLGWGPAEINDDGRAPDLKARDGVYTGKAPFVESEHAARQAAYLDRISKDDSARVMGFDGLQVVDAAPFGAAAISQPGSVVVAGVREPLDTVVLFPSVNEDVVAGLAGLPPATDASRTLTITDPGVVRDPTRTGVWVHTQNGCEQVGDPAGPWGIVGLMEGIGGGYGTAHDMVMDWLKLYDGNRTLNGQLVTTAHPGLNMLIEGDAVSFPAIPAVPWTKLVDDGNPWTFNDVMDLTRMPVQLTAIVNRPDLAVGGYGEGEHRPELRFVFTFINEEICAPDEGGFILEYDVPAADCSALEAWFQSWDNLGQEVPGTAQYNDALELITAPITASGAGPGRPNNSNLKVLRTNERNIRWEEYPNDFPTLNVASWMIQQFAVDPTTHRFVDEPLPQTPAWPYELVDWNDPAPRPQPIDGFIQSYAADIVAGTYSVDLNYPGTTDPFRAAFALYGHFGAATFTPPYTAGMGPPTWSGAMNRMLTLGSAAQEPGYLEPRKRFSLNSCNGCHYGETFEDGDGTGVFESRHEGPSTPGAVLEEPFRHVQPPSVLGAPARLSRFLTGTNAGCAGAEFVTPLGPLAACASPACCPIGDPVFGYQKGQAHFNDHARRGQILQDVLTNGCSVLDGHAAADIIVSAAH